MEIDVLVAGGGSGGFGAALAAARAGCSVLLVEPRAWLGGTSTHSGVNGWESGCGGTGFPFELYRRLKRIPRAVGIYRVGRHCCWPDEGAYPGGEGILDPDLTYADTLVRCALGPLSYGRAEDRKVIRKRWNGVVFEPETMSRVMLEMLAETGRTRLLSARSVVDAIARDGRVTGVRLSDGTTVEPHLVVDSTGDAVLCAACAVPQLYGQDARQRFNEPDAPELPSASVNGVTLSFRVSRKSTPGVDALPEEIPPACWWRQRFPVAHVVHYPNGDMNVNMLPTMEGSEFHERGYADAYAECERRLRAFWHAKQTEFSEWQRYRISWIAPTLGIRESRRTLCETMLTQLDIAAGLDRQQQDDIVAIADHVMDVHGNHGGGCCGTTAAYGIPFGCLIPKGFRNLLVASRAAGFSSLAASSCRLSRTIMQLGQAAGTACAIALHRQCPLPDVPAEDLRAELRRQHVCLEFPPADSLQAYVRAE